MGSIKNLLDIIPSRVNSCYLVGNGNNSFRVESDSKCLCLSSSVPKDFSWLGCSVFSVREGLKLQKHIIQDNTTIWQHSYSLNWRFVEPKKNEAVKVACHGVGRDYGVIPPHGGHVASRNNSRIVHNVPKITNSSLTAQQDLLFAVDYDVSLLIAVSLTFHCCNRVCDHW